MKRIVFSDVDGTLLNSRQEITPLTERAIKALKEKCLIERVGSNKTGYWKIINHA